MEISKKALAVIGGVGVFLLLAVIGALIAALLLAGGSGDDEKSEPKTVKTTEPSITPEVPDIKPDDSINEQAFLEVVREKGITGTDEELLEMGYGVCDLFDAGQTFEDFLDQAIKENPTQQEAEQYFYFIGVSVGAFCPEHADKIRAGASSGT